MGEPIKANPPNNRIPPAKTGPAKGAGKPATKGADTADAKGADTADAKGVEERGPRQAGAADVFVDRPRIRILVDAGRLSGVGAHGVRGEFGSVFRGGNPLDKYGSLRYGSFAGPDDLRLQQFLRFAGGQRTRMQSLLGRVTGQLGLSPDTFSIYGRTKSPVSLMGKLFETDGMPLNRVFDTSGMRWEMGRFSQNFDEAERLVKLLQGELGDSIMEIKNYNVKPNAWGYTGRIHLRVKDAAGLVHEIQLGPRDLSGFIDGNLRTAGGDKIQLHDVTGFKAKVYLGYDLPEALNTRYQGLIGEIAEANRGGQIIDDLPALQSKIATFNADVEKALPNRINKAPALPNTQSGFRAFAARGLGVLGLIGGGLTTYGGVQEMRSGEYFTGGLRTSSGLLETGGGIAVIGGRFALGTGLGGAGAVIDGGRDMYLGVRDGDVERGAIGGAKTIGGGLMLAGVASANPVLVVVGGLVYLGAVIYDNWDSIESGLNWLAGNGPVGVNRGRGAWNHTMMPGSQSCISGAPLRLDWSGGTTPGASLFDQMRLRSGDRTPLLGGTEEQSTNIGGWGTDETGSSNATGASMSAEDRQALIDWMRSLAAKDAADAEAPKTETPKTETPKTETPNTEAPKTAAPKTETGEGTSRSTVEPARNQAFGPQPLEIERPSNHGPSVEERKEITDWIRSQGKAASVTPRPRVSVATPQPNDEVPCPKPTVSVAAPKPTVSVAAPKPSVSVATPKPIVSVAAPKPSVSVATPKPIVSVATPKPNVSVATPKPIVSVAAPKPTVSVATPKPSVSVATPKPAVSLARPAGSVAVTTNRAAYGAMVGASSGRMTNVAVGSNAEVQDRIRFTTDAAYRKEQVDALRRNVFAGKRPPNNAAARAALAPISHRFSKRVR